MVDDEDKIQERGARSEVGICMPRSHLRRGFNRRTIDGWRA